MKLIPLGDRVLLEPIFPKQELAEKLEENSGLSLPPIDDKQSFEGVPEKGIVRELPEEYDGPLKIGMKVFFKSERPSGFKLDDGTRRIVVDIKDCTIEIRET